MLNHVQVGKVIECNRVIDDNVIVIVIHVQIWNVIVKVVDCNVIVIGSM